MVHQSSCRHLFIALAIFLAYFTREVSAADDSLNAQALFSFASYCPEDFVRNWTCFWCLHPDAHKLTVIDTIYNKNDDSYAYVGYTKNYIQISIRGTIMTSLTDWIRDLQFTMVPYEDMADIKVHNGFYKVYKGLEYNLFQSFQRARKLCPNCGKVRITGHSLGGAVATIAALELQNVTKLPVVLTTYGSPRVGNTAFAKLVTSEVEYSTRVVHESDAVPHVPPKMVGYWHVSMEEWYHKGDSVECDGTGEDPNCSNQVMVPSVTDHMSYMGYNLLNGFPNCAGLFADNPPA